MDISLTTALCGYVMLLATCTTPQVQPAPALPPPPSPSVTIAPGYPLSSAQLALLGAATSPRLERSVVIERFQNGVMVVFAKASQGFDVTGGEFIFALAKDGSAWRIADTFVETGKNSDDWYTCERKPGQRPERSGVPWRGFGKAWCEHSEVRAALGSARGYEESEITASLQSFERGRAFQLADWRGIPGWDREHMYSVFLNSSDPNFAAGRWE